MDVDPKSRGLKHVKNKKKYNKPKSSIQTQIPTKLKSSTILESNWSRYQSDDDDDDDGNGVNTRKLDSRTDFSILANIPIGQGSHFQFKTKQSLIDDVGPMKSNDLFKLDLNLLDLSISTIPFHKRCNIDQSYFTKNQQEAMIKTSIENQQIYENYLNKNNLTITNRSVFDLLDDDDDDEDLSSNSSTEQEGHQVVSQDEDNDSANFKINLNNNIDKNIESDKLQNIAVQNDVNNENLEEWLDDILDD